MGTASDAQPGIFANRNAGEIGHVIIDVTRKRRFDRSSQRRGLDPNRARRAEAEVERLLGQDDAAPL